MAALLLRVLMLAGLLGLPSCALVHREYGQIGGITYAMSTKRPAIPGGKKYSIDWRVPVRGAKTGELLVDGVSFGGVDRGSYVDVTDAGVVLVDGEARQPGGQPTSAPTSGAPTSGAPTTGTMVSTRPMRSWR